VAKDTGERAASSTARRKLKVSTQTDWRVLALSVAGVFFILLGLIAFSLPNDQEGDLLLPLSTAHAVHLMDFAGLFTAGMGVMLTWLGGRVWKRQLRS